MSLFARSIARPLRTVPTRSFARTFATTPRAWNAAPTPAPAEGRQLLEGENAIAAKLIEKFKPSKIEVEDVSGGCGTFYAITIQSSAFTGMPLVQQHRLVTKAIKEDIEGIHGLQLKTIPETP